MFKRLGLAHISLRIPPEAAHELAARHGFEGLGEIGFDGPVIVEPFNVDVQALPPPERVAAVAASLAAAWPG